MTIRVVEEAELWGGWERMRVAGRQLAWLAGNHSRRADRLLIWAWAWAWYRLPFLRRFLRPRLERAVFGETR